MTFDHVYLPPPSPGDTLKRILVIRLGPLSDFIQTLGAMRVVRAAHPSARITLLTTQPFEAFAKACPYIDIVEADGEPKDQRARSELVRRLRSSNYDMVYDFQNDEVSTGYFSILSGRKLFWSGEAAGASHQHRNPGRASMHNFDRLADQLEHAGLGPRGPGDPSGWNRARGLIPHLDWIRPAFRDPPRFHPEFFGLHASYALLVPGSSPGETEKRWPRDRFRQIATWLADNGLTPAIIGNKAEGEIGSTIQRAEQRAVNLVSRTDLFQLATLAEKAALVIGGDTGPVHLAAAAGCSGVCLLAQTWDDGMAREFGTIWASNTRLARRAPRGSAMIALYSDTVEDIALEDVQRAVQGLGVLPR